MMLSEAVESVSRMVDAYPNGGATAGKSYIGSLSAVLCSYPRQVAIACADVRNGVVATTKFLPTVADVVAWCEPRVEAMATTIKREEQRTQQFRDREKFDAERQPFTDPVPTWCRANLFVPSTSPKFDAMLQLAEQRESRNSHRTPTGIWVPLDWYTDAPMAAKGWKQFTKADLEAMYARADQADAQRAAEAG